MNTKRNGAAAVLGIVLITGVTSIAGKAHPKTTNQASPHAPAPTDASTPKKAEEQFKNIQVLKGIPAEQVFPTMQFVAASLGVECDFCHVQGAFEKDDKKTKQTARKMMEMMFAINKENFDGHREVTCYSCHRGNARPQAIPAVMTEETAKEISPPKPMAGPGGADRKEPSGPSPEQLLDKYLQASGGASAIDSIASRVMKGTIDFGGKSLPIDIYSRAPDKRISFTHMAEGDSVTAYNGREGWLGIPGHPLREMHGSDLEGASLDADLHLPAHLKSMFTEMRSAGTEKIGDRETYVVVGNREGNPPVRLYFDEQSGFLVRLIRFGETALGWMPTRIDYADYRSTDKVSIPYRWTLARPGGRFTIQLSDVRQNVPVEDSVFVKPPAQPEKKAAQ